MPLIATAEEHNALFPARPITVRLLALDQGLLNLGAAALGAVPMCRGVGGMAGHVRFGARTGGAVVILGVVLLLMGLLFADSMATLFRLFPPPVYLVDAAARVDDVERALGSVPAPGTALVTAGHRWTVVEMDGPRIRRLSVHAA